MAEDDDKYKLYLFGRDIRRMPCVRSALLYGITGAIGSGLLAFLFTSRGITAVKTTGIAYCVISNSYWLHCRYNYSLQQKHIMEFKEAMDMIRETEEIDEADKVAEVGVA